MIMLRIFVVGVFVAVDGKETLFKG